VVRLINGAELTPTLHSFSIYKPSEIPVLAHLSKPYYRVIARQPGERLAQAIGW